MRRLVLLATAVLLPALLGAAARGEDGDAREVWRFRKGEHVRTVDVTDLPDAVRTVVARRLAEEGYERVAEDAGEPAVGRDLRADAEALVRGGGRLRHGTDGSPARFLGAFLAWPDDGDADAGPRVLGCAPGTLAAALGLEAGDRILAVDGRPATPRRLAARAGAEHTPGQLELGIRRRDGRNETLGLEFRRGPAPRPAREREDR